MDSHRSTGTNGVLEGLILRAEEVLGKMLLKLQRTRMPLEEKVRMINALHAFVEQWEGALADVKLPPELQQLGQSPPSKPKSHGDEIMDVMQKLGLNGDDGGGGRPVKNGGRSVVAVPVPQEEAEPVFEVLEQSLKEYSPGQPGTCFVTYTCPGSRRFFMMDRTDRDEADRTDRLLASLQNGETFRAVRSRSEPAWLWLLDTGAVLPYEESMLLFELPEFYRRQEPLARCCELVDVTDRKFRGGDLARFLEVNLFCGREFEVVRVRGKVLHVNLGRAVARKRNGVVKKINEEPTAEYRISEKTLTQEQLDLTEMQALLNDPRNVKTFRPLDHKPYTREYVIARYAEDGQWYRAEVLDYFHDGLVVVLYLDYGNQERLGMADLRTWDDRFDYLPFQAVHCRLANGTVALREVIYDKRVAVKVLDVRSYWEVLVYDGCGIDVGEFLVSRKVALPRNPIVIDDAEAWVPAFCIVDRDHRDCTKLLAAMQHSHGSRLAQLPARPGDVFGVFLEGTLFRAVRNRPPLEGSRMRTDYIRLLDTGEVLAYEEDGGGMLCELSEYYRKLPAFAIRCVLVNVLDDPFSCDDLNRYLRKNLHATQNYKVVSAEGHILYLRLSQQPITENPFSGDLSADSATSSLSDSSDSEPSSLEETRVKPRTPRLVAPPSPQKKPTTPRWNIFKVDNPDKSNGTPIIRPAGIPPEKPPTPPKKKPDSDDYVVPPVGSHLYLVPKFIRDVDHFWCHVVEGGDRVNADLMELELKLNDAEYSRTFRKFDRRPPAFAEPVFAKYTDRKWYRAEVAEYFDEDNVKVFYVDYGNCELVRTDEMRRWDERFSYLPYQAVMCRLADVQAVRPFHKQAVVEMNRVLLNQRVLAKVVDNGTPWEVILYDRDGFNVATGLLLAGLAKKLFEDAAELAEAARLISAQRETASSVRGR
ncbi:hypothetical protein pipiens_014469 [Culex pipiens pipiens]|uniref:Tudor domain-containing protein n=1 Tax=Culex pipiens pipiens TaxID=38569 RepID=A0ABD1CUH8_CULPP